MWTRDILKNHKTVWAYILLAKYSTSDPSEFLKLRKVLVLSKRTRYELEKLQKPGISDQHMEKIIRKRGSDYDTMIRHHNLHKDFHDRLLHEFSRHSLEVHSVNKTDYTREAINWADIVVPVGGDGTFLLAASKITTREKPVVGFNSDPQRSEGYLCLPKSYSYQISKAVDKIIQGEFKWLFRNRIQVKLTGPGGVFEDLGELADSPQTRLKLLLQRGIAMNDETIKQPTTRILPYLALNEVFLGESVSSQVSYFEIELPGFTRTKVKCSGLCVCTGTGSTSWNLSINRLTTHKVQRLLNIAGLLSHTDVEEITARFNNSLVFSPGSKMLLECLLCERGEMWGSRGLPW